MKLKDHIIGIGAIVLFAICFGLFLTGCEGKQGAPVPVQESYDDFKVQKLFITDGCTVYRFVDDGRYRYFTNCSGETISTHSCGKNCTADETVKTHK